MRRSRDVGGSVIAVDVVRDESGALVEAPCGDVRVLGL
jgi:hypothetical protein